MRMEQTPRDSDSNVSYITLFRFASKFDILLISTALIVSFCAGLTLPYGIAIVAHAFQSMIDYDKSVQAGNRDEETFLNALFWFSIKYSFVGTDEIKRGHVLCGVILFISGYVGTALIDIAAINQILKIREAYLKAALNQDFSYFDTQPTGDFASRMSDDVIKLEDGIGDKLSSVLYNVATSFGCLIVAFVRGWKLALFCLTFSPILLLLIWLTGKIAERLSKKEAAETSKASAVAEEVLSCIRTVYAFNGQDKELARYKKHLMAARKIDVKKEFLTGLTMGVVYLCIFSSYGLSFYFGVHLVIHEPETYDAGVMITVFFSVMTGMISIGIVGTLASTFGLARGAGAHIFSLIDNKPTINPLLDRGIKPSTVEGNIEFQNVVFCYPSRPELPVLQGLNLTLKRGQSVALVGPSGCGKSTVIQLVSRNYDVVSGKVTFDGYDVRELSVRWLRAQVGLVGQEPVLFNTTVRENIRYGREDASDADIVVAARQAHAHEFIMKLPKGYRTFVGECGASLSGGQKQRIAIARALVQNPTILLLDEATSALDTFSEFEVQKALEEASKGRTTIIIAHRLSTIRNVDVIYVMKDGKVFEQGDHESLMKLQGLYYYMSSLQNPPDLVKNKDEEEKDHQRLREASVASQDLYSDINRRSTVFEDHKLKWPPLSFCRVMKLNSPEWVMITIGSICSTVIGFSVPLYILVFGKLLGAMSSSDPDVLFNQVYTVSGVCIGIGVVLAVSNLIEALSFGIAGARLTERIRILMFKHLLRQQIGFFDEHSHSTGALCSSLSSEAAYVRRATGQRIGTLLQGLGAVSLALALAMGYEYRVGLIALFFLPVFAIIVYYQGKATFKESFGTAQTLERSTKIAIEAMANVRTVASLGRERKFIEEYVAQLRPALEPAKVAAHFRGLVSAVSRSMMNFINAAMLIYGGNLIVTDGIRYEHVLIATQALQIASVQAQNAFAFSPDFQKGINAASRAIALLNTKPTMSDPEKEATAPIKSLDAASFENVEFRYPTRPGVKILRGLNFHIQRGETIALVGESGCGKSTIVSLLERFYDPESGIVALEGIPLQKLYFKDIRANFGLVSQEPVLFDRTIQENIAYGDNARLPTYDEIISAATQANIHSFIQTLPEGYESNIGSKGVQLSGGQKQRIAIARALIRNPKILLLDEATSALDTDSEKVVQEALDRAKVGRTCVIIAHRLSTVRDADVICVIRRGRVVETGTHDQLIRRQGFYYELHSKEC